MKRLLTALVFVSAPFAQTTGDLKSFTGAAAIDAAISHAIEANQIPGAVAVVGYEGTIVYRKTYGSRSLLPALEPMTEDTIFDVASLTKVVATTSSIMKLVEKGRVRLNDKVTEYIPEFQGGTSDITVRQLLTHYSGLRPFFLFDSGGYAEGIKLAVSDRPTAAPGSRFTYSDINFILLGEIVRRTSGATLADFARTEIFTPLGMKNTTFNPPAQWKTRIAPTELMPNTIEPLRGIVHDPRARAMGGIAGHAGLFSTASDLGRFAQMLLNEGQLDGKRIFSPLTIRAMTTPQTPLGQPVLRGLGWDIDSPYSGPRGDLFPIGSFGHTGFTGTSLWVDPSTHSFVILLSNSVHPKLRPAITPLRARVASAAAAGLPVQSVGILPAALQHLSTLAPKPVTRNAEVLTGIDVLAAENFQSLRGKRVGLITNHTGISRDGKRNIDLMVAAGVQLTAIFAPEHGLAGVEDRENIGHSKDVASGVRVFSLYAGERRPSPEMLKGLDVLVFDIQDVGTRFYTYVCTMLNTMEEAAKHKVQYVVLDRPNPINGVTVEGPMLEPGARSFVGCIDMPIRHGMTVGELASMVNDTLSPKTNLRVVTMRNWQRSDWFDATGLTWVDPSPNMRSLNAAVLYPGVGMLELDKGYSVGRGTDAPFEHIGASWIKGRVLAKYLNDRRIPGVRIYPTSFKPVSSNFAGKTVEGVRFVITDRDALSSTRLGIEIGCALAKLFPGKMTWAASEKLAGGKRVLSAIAAVEQPARIEESFAAELESFRLKRSRFLLY